MQLRASKATREGAELETAGGTLRVLGREGELSRVATPGDALAFFEAHGEVPLPPYITRAADASDRERYQSVFARDPGAVAAPTASLHFDAPLLAALAARGIESATVTLHVGRRHVPAAARRRPRRARDARGALCGAAGALLEAVLRTRYRGGRVVAVGTTVARTLEAAAASGALRAGAGETRLFIRPGYDFRVVDALLTNFHLPESTLMMLVSRVRRARAHPRGLCARGPRALSLLQLRRRDAAAGATAAG